MLSEELILHFLPKMFKKYEVKEKSLLRVTRNADIDTETIYDEDLDDKSKLIPQIMEKDVLLSYPFESIKPFIKLLYEAAKDDSVVSIKMTLYHLADKSQIVDALVEAAENGKEVLLVAPKCLRNRVVDMIEEEIRHVQNGEEGYIGIKINSLTDKVIIDKLVEAS